MRMMVIRNDDDDDDDGDDGDNVTTVARTGKLHLVVDDTEAEHVRVGHQHFLVLDNIAIIIIIVINLTVIIIESQKCCNFQHCHQKRFHYRDQTLSG